MRISEALQRRRLLLDGAMGTMVQERGLGETDFRGSVCPDCGIQMKGNNDILVLTRPDVVGDIHYAYLEAGADIITTDTFSAQRVSQHEYMLEAKVADINRAAVRIARDAVRRFETAHPETAGTHYILGDVGPTSRMLSMSDDVTDPAARSITFDELCNAYAEQMTALMEEGVDGILIETSFDTLNVKAAIAAYERTKEKLATQRAAGCDTELIISMTISDASGRILSGQTIEAFVETVMYARPLAVGLNCGMGAGAMVPYLRRMREAAAGRCYISCHPNAGLPNQMGQYDDTPEDMERQMTPFVEEGLADIIGGCCGTTPMHTSRMRALCDKHSGTYRGNKDRLAEKTEPETLTLTGLEAFGYGSGDFVVVGERCNVAGSRKFLRLISEKKYDEALDIARIQVEHGAMVVDVNMDDGLLDTKAEMTAFLNMLMSDPSVCRVPVMIDSSVFDVVEAGLKCCQGKCIVNSISLKQGEEAFISNALRVKRLGAAVIVMLFDEEGQATDYNRRIDIAQRAYRLLTEKAGIQPSDIIFDPNILTVATGMEEHRNYARHFIEATAWIRQNLPGARVSGGLSNLSFAFRGNNEIREAMHAVFLHHAREAGMGMAIMNPMTAVEYDSIPDNVRDAIRAVILNESDDATERLIAIAADMAKRKEAEKAAEKGNAGQHTATNTGNDTAQTEEDDTPEAHLVKALMQGSAASVEKDLNILIGRGMTPLEIIGGPLMEGMNRVGKLFGEGKMFLPQVVKTARTMKKAVDIVMPQPGDNAGTAEKGPAPDDAAKAGTVVMATVKGDVHDIGKNIVGVVMACNGFRIIDLGVMVTADRIVEECVRSKADIVCLSGLITPSLDEMCHVAEAMQKAGLTIPLMVGGATTSEIHTAVKIAPLYAGGVFHMRDASQNPVTAMRLADPATREETLLANRSRQQRIRMAQQRKEQRMKIHRATGSALGEPSPLQRRFACDWQGYTPALPPFEGCSRTRRIPLKDIAGHIDWMYFYWAWRVKEDSDEGRMLRADAEQRIERMAADTRYDMLAVQTFLPARGTEDSITTPMTVIHTPRQAERDANGHRREQCLALCDFVSPLGNDFVGAFAATVAPAFVEDLEQLKQAAKDDYECLLMQTIGDRLAEATAEFLGKELADGYTSETDGTTQKWGGIRPAIGYPSLPEQKAIFSLKPILDFDAVGISLTENGAMYPQASVAGLYISHPDARYFG